MKQKASRVLGVDSSTRSLAWTVWFNRRPECFGEIELDGELRQRLGTALSEFDVVLAKQLPDFVAIEKPVYMNSKDTFGKLSKVVGVLQASCASAGVPAVEVTPYAWQRAIGNTSYSAKQKKAVRRANPGRSKSWIRNEIRRLRKQYTIDYMNKRYGCGISSDNIADSMGVARYAYNYLTRRG